MKQLIPLLIVSLLSTQCGSEPLVCPCYVLRVLSAGNDSPIEDVYLTFTSPSLPPSYGYSRLSPGRFALYGPACQAGTFTILVQHTNYQPQEVSVAVPTTTPNGSSAECARIPPRDPIVVRLVPR